VPTERSDVFCESAGRVSDTVVTAGKYQPTLRRRPLVFAAPLPKRGPASLLLDQDPRGALPAVTLTSAGSEPNEWLGRTDLLRSEGDAAHFVVEIDDEGVAHLRFGDGECGRVPEAALKFTARYRVGGGIAGNIGAESIRQLVWPGTLRVEGAISEVRNPLPARGGMPPEPIAEAKLFAPRAFRKKLERAITAEDYAAIVTREFPDEVQRAGAELRWTGSWYSVRVAIDPLGSDNVSDGLCEKIERALRRYRRMGHDLQVVQARYVPLDIAITICVLPHFLRGHVKAALLDIFQSGMRQNGERGFFHPDNLSFGDSIYLSRIVAAVQAVEGVESAQVTKLRRRFESANYELANGLVRIGPLEIPRLDGDPLRPENGRLKLDLKGGR
jgi:predicted phage baseplate assembly protein